jgi:hypothetical protein
MNLETDCVMEERDNDQDLGASTRTQLEVEWTESEWFRIYLQLARKDQNPHSD